MEIFIKAISTNRQNRTITPFVLHFWLRTPSGFHDRASKENKQAQGMKDSIVQLKQDYKPTADTSNAMLAEVIEKLTSSKKSPQEYIIRELCTRLKKNHSINMRFLRTLSSYISSTYDTAESDYQLPRCNGTYSPTLLTTSCVCQFS